MNPDIDESTLVRDTLNASRMMMTLLENNFSNPMDAYVALVFTLASLSHGMDIDLDHTLAGVASAYEDLAASRAKKKDPLS
jgi:hypothetical protein